MELQDDIHEIYNFDIQCRKLSTGYWIVNSEKIPGIVLTNKNLKLLLNNVVPVIKILLEENLDWDEVDLKIFEVKDG